MKSLVIAVLVLMVSSIQAQQYIGRYVELHFKDGFVEVGTIVGYIKGYSITLMGDDGIGRTYQTSDISQIRPAQKQFRQWQNVPQQNFYQPQQQYEPQYNRPGKKNGGTALVLSLLVVGGGQFYNGEVGKGLLMLTGAVIGVGLISSSQGMYYTQEELDQAKSRQTLGALLWLGSALWSVIDAPISSNRINRQNGYAHLLQHGKAGLDIAYNRDILSAQFTFHF